MAVRMQTARFLGFLGVLTGPCELPKTDLPRDIYIYSATIWVRAGGTTPCSCDSLATFTGTILAKLSS